MFHTRPLLLLLVLALALPSLLACGDPEAQAEGDDPEQMARQAPPEHDPEATYKGRTAAEHAERLADLSHMRQLSALEDIAAMGVHGLPAREAIHALIDGIEARNLDPRVAEHVELAALGTLYHIEAPEAPAMARQRILDPGYSERTGTYRRLMGAALNSGMDPESLGADIIGLATSEPEHAARLLRTEALPDTVQADLAQALFPLDHDAETTRFFLEKLADFDFIEPAQTLDYIRSHQDLASENSRATHSLLVIIGTEEALDLALDVSGSTAVGEPRLVGLFAQSEMGAERAMERILEAAMAAETPEAIKAATDALGGLTQELIRPFRGRTAEPGTPEMNLEIVHDLHVGALARLIREGSTEAHQAQGIESLGGYLRNNREVPPNPALEPVFAIATSPEHGREARLNAQQTLQATVTSFGGALEQDPEYVYTETVRMLWTGTDAETTEVAQRILGNARRSSEHAALVLEQLSLTMEAHLDDWAVNPAAAVALSLASMDAFDRHPAREQGTVVVGQLIASEQADLAFLEPPMRRHMNTLANAGNNSATGTIGLIGPTIFAEHAALHREFEPAAFAQIMLQQPAWLTDEPGAAEQWQDFLQQVVAADREHFSTTAQEALDAL
ncbi:hypothetical protein [Thioalkalivibrio paradoxus]|nr:hypothetical protein [Thioalkalivibrio paradoxus]